MGGCSRNLTRFAFWTLAVPTPPDGVCLHLEKTPVFPTPFPFDLYTVDYEPGKKIVLRNTVGAVGIEPTTVGLRGHCSTD